MTAATAVRAGTGARGAPRDVAQWGMICLIASEAMLFAYLLSSYLYLAEGQPRWPPHGPPRLGMASLNTVILLSSGATMAWADRQLRRERHREFRIGVGATLLLGVVFLAIQGSEYRHETFGLRTDAYGSSFFVTTGLHGAHVLMGLLLLSYVLVRELAGHFTARQRVGVTNAGMYWHFVNVVWLFAFSVLYLFPHLA